MAKITYNHSASEHFPEFTETIEVRVWGVAGSEEMPFYIGSGVNYQSSAMLWLEIFHSVEGAQIFYTRSLLHHDPFHRAEPASLEKYLDEVVEKGEGKFGFGGSTGRPTTKSPRTTSRTIKESHALYENSHRALTVCLCDRRHVVGEVSSGGKWKIMLILT